jgi:hypothetical protein
MLEDVDKRERTEILDSFEKSIRQLIDFTIGLFGDIFPDTPISKKVRDYMSIRSGKLKKSKATITSRLKAKQLQDIMGVAKQLEFIGDDTDLFDFVSVFSGEIPRRKIIWTDTIFTLAQFIKGIQGTAIKPLGHGKWYAVADCFQHYKRGKLLPEQLSKSSHGSKERMQQLDKLIAAFNDPF